ncbi:UNVERIFIED_CONTAM: hypothetical protein Sradi_0452900 [Sesamum radiatum]|uniref:Reverse transcriptase zinc-binding domain-containing protein n=1 Tax=Sesamum radiatum TaxID=300843 RepID=A0AAW2W847_SESRA
MSLQVQDLIDLNTGEWDSATVSAIFWPIDYELILNIPLSRLGAEDLVMWHYANNSLFSVRSAYHLMCAMEFRPCSSDSREAEQQWWWRMWQARLPCKVRVFAWRAALNALPTSLNLLKRIPDTSSICPFCHEGKEDLIHALVHCTFAWQVWGLSNISSTVIFSTAAAPLPWLQFASSALEDEEFRYFLCLCWTLWNWDWGDCAGFRWSCIAWLSRRLASRASSELVEAMAAREAVLLAMRHGWQSILICLSQNIELLNETAHL